MKRDVWMGALLVVLAIALPGAENGGVSGVFWAFTIVALLLWASGYVARSKEGQPGATAQTRTGDERNY